MATKSPPEKYLQYWIAAAEQEIGICITVADEDRALFVNRLYEARDVFGGYEDYMIFQPNPPGTVFIRKTEIGEME